MTIACFQVVGNRPVESEILKSFAMYGPTVVAQSLSSHVGIGSESHCFVGEVGLQTSGSYYFSIFGIYVKI